MYLSEIILRLERRNETDVELERQIFFDFFKYQHNYFGHINSDKKYANISTPLKQKFSEYKAFMKVCETYKL